MSFHWQCEHLGINWMFYFARMVNPAIHKTDVRMVVKKCEACLSIDLALMQWKKGQLGASNAWQKMGMDITHYGGNHFLPLSTVGLHILQSGQPLSIFFEPGASRDDNDPAFCSQQIKQFLQEWGLQRQCAYVSLGNDIAERSHCSIKKIEARKQCTISEATYWYNITLKDGVSPATVPAKTIYKYRVQEKRIHTKKHLTTRTGVNHMLWVIPSGYPPHRRCTTKFKLGQVTIVVSHHSAKVNGVLHHIKDLCFFQGLIQLSDSESNTNNQPAEGGIPIALGPTPLDDTSDAPGRMWITHQWMKIQKVTFLPFHSGGTLGKRGLLQVAWCAIRTGGEPSPSTQKSVCLYHPLTAQRGPIPCMLMSSPSQPNRVVIWRGGGDIQVTQCLVLVWGCPVLKSMQMTDHCVETYGQPNTFLMLTSSQEKA